MYIHKLTVPSTVEDRQSSLDQMGGAQNTGILALQESKRQLAQAALSGGKVDKKMKLTLEDMLKLFRGGVHGDAEVSDEDED